MSNEFLPHIGDLLDGKYLILRILGQGSFSTVYLAKSIARGNEHAIKVYESLSKSSLSVLGREIQALTSLRHLHIVNLFEYGVNPDTGGAYLVSEYINGASLDQILEGKRLELRQALEIGISVAKALIEIHSHRIIHRDVKPSNILVPKKGGKFEFHLAKLSDFGISSALLPDVQTTMPGELFGTPYFMAPEQMSADAQSTASDIYSFGAVLFEAVTSERLFQEETLHELFKAKSSKKDIENYYLPKKLENFISNCIEFDPSKRPTAKEAFTFLENFVHAMDLGSSDVQILRKRSRRTKRGSSRTKIKPVFNEKIDILVNTQNERPGLTAFFPLVGIATATLFLLFFGIAYPILSLFAGLIYGICGIFLGLFARSWIKSRKNYIDNASIKLNVVGKSRDLLTESLAIQIDDYFKVISQPGDRLMLTSLAIMINEFKEAKENKDRQEALMKAVTIIEKLSVRVSPWYIKNEKLLTVAVMLVGIVSALVTIAVTIVKLFADKPN